MNPYEIILCVFKILQLMGDLAVVVGWVILISYMLMSSKKQRREWVIVHETMMGSLKEEHEVRMKILQDERKRLGDGEEWRV